MNVNITAKYPLGSIHRSLLYVSLLLTLLLSLFSCTFMIQNVTGSSLEDVIHVKNESELKAAINNAPYRGNIVTIALDKDITLSSTLTIPSAKSIVLTSNSVVDFFKLIGASGQCTIETFGNLTLDGIVVTHANSADGRGVLVNSGSLL